MDFEKEGPCGIYMVVEYMDHDLTGLVNCPKMRFSVSHIKVQIFSWTTIPGLSQLIKIGILPIVLSPYGIKHEASCNLSFIYPSVFCGMRRNI
ncbi:Cyclin-dependent kinase C-2 [Bienertia sinuspersici]